MAERGIMTTGRGDPAHCLICSSLPATPLLPIPRLHFRHAEQLLDIFLAFFDRIRRHGLDFDVGAPHGLDVRHGHHAIAAALAEQPLLVFAGADGDGVSEAGHADAEHLLEFFLQLDAAGRRVARGGDLAAVAADVGAAGRGEGRAGLGADVLDCGAEGWDCGRDEDRALLEGRGVEVGDGAVWMVVSLCSLGLMTWESSCLRVKSQSAAKISSSSIVRQTAAPQAMLLKPRRAEANHFARLVVWRPMIMKTGVRTRAPSVNALNARRCERLSNNMRVCIKMTYHQRTLRSVTRVIACSMLFGG